MKHQESHEALLEQVTHLAFDFLLGLALSLALAALFGLGLKVADGDHVGDARTQLLLGTCLRGQAQTASDTTCLPSKCSHNFI